jgi:hypothetical protein
MEPGLLGGDWRSCKSILLKIYYSFTCNASVLPFLGSVEYRVQSDCGRRKLAVKTSQLKTLLAQKGSKLLAHFNRAPSISAAAQTILYRNHRRESQKEGQTLELDLDLFKRTLGSSPPAEFNAEGGLRERWAAAQRRELERKSCSPKMDQSEVEADPWQAEIKRKRLAAVRNAAIMLLAWTALSILWSKTEWQRQLELALLQPNAAQDLSPPHSSK